MSHSTPVPPWTQLNSSNNFRELLRKLGLTVIPKKKHSTSKPLFTLLRKSGIVVMPTKEKNRSTPLFTLLGHRCNPIIDTYNGHGKISMANVKLLAVLRVVNGSQPDEKERKLKNELFHWILRYNERRAMQARVAYSPNAFSCLSLGQSYLT